MADVAADRPGGYVDGRRSTTVGSRTAFVVFRAWPDDPAWRGRVTDLVIRGLPILAEAIGAPWPLDGPLTVTETLVRSTGGYAGIFDPEKALAQIGYTASPGVVLHEAAHAWFNGALVADRWIAEAFASFYAEQAAETMDVAIESPELADLPTGAAFPLNAWRATGEADPEEDAFGFAASLALAREIAGRVGMGALRETWGMPRPASRPTSPRPGRAADERRRDAGPRPEAAAETGADPPDWRALLDLLEANADPSAAAGLERLWRRWVRPTGGRGAARGADRGPSRVRGRGRGGGALAAAPLDPRRDAGLAVRRGARDRGRRPRRPPAARAGHAGGRRGRPHRARRHSSRCSRPTTRWPRPAPRRSPSSRRSTASRRPWRSGSRNRGSWIALGLIGVDPEARLAAARAAFEAGDQDTALAEAAAAEAEWSSVPDVARGRLTSATLLTAAVLLLAWLVAQRRRRRRSCPPGLRPPTGSGQTPGCEAR